MPVMRICEDVSCTAQWTDWQRKQIFCLFLTNVSSMNEKVNITFNAVHIA